ncbi:MAG: DUF3574 domain-containing protein [Clostridia bacterium]
MKNNKNQTNRNGLKYKVLLLLLLLNLVVTGGLVVYELGWIPSKPPSHTNYVLEPRLQTARKYTLYIGTNDKDTYTQLIPTNQARDIINEICTRHVGGYTAWEAMGGWVDETGTLTQEHTLVYSFYDAEEEQMTAVMDEILDKLNQNTILIESGKVASMYYGGSEK